MTPYVYNKFYSHLRLNLCLMQAIRTSGSRQDAEDRIVEVADRIGGWRDLAQRQRLDVMYELIAVAFDGRHRANPNERDEPPPRNAARLIDNTSGCFNPTAVRMESLIKEMENMYLVRTATGRLRADDTLAFYNYIPRTIKPKEPTIMSQKFEIETRTFLNGRLASYYSSAELIEKIEQAEAEVARLKNVKTKSAKIDARVAELGAGAVQLAELLDARK